MLVDRLWPRSIRKEALKYDVWEKNLAPSTELRQWFHEDPEARWGPFASMYRKEPETSETAKNFAAEIRPCDTVTLLYAAKSPDRNHALILQHFLADYS